jgi:hypothetical protein
VGGSDRGEPGAATPEAVSGAPEAVAEATAEGAGGTPGKTVVGDVSLAGAEGDPCAEERKEERHDGA